MLQYISIIKKINAVELIDLFFIKIVLKFSTLDNIIINRKSVFTNTFWSKVYYNLYIKRRLSTAFYP